MCKCGECQLCLAASVEAKQNTIVHPDGGISVAGKAAIARLRVIALRSSLSLEAKGLKLSRRVSALKIARKDYGIKAKTAKEALVKLDELLKELEVVGG